MPSGRRRTSAVRQPSSRAAEVHRCAPRRWRDFPAVFASAAWGSSASLSPRLCPYCEIRTRPASTPCICSTNLQKRLLHRHRLLDAAQPHPGWSGGAPESRLTRRPTNARSLCRICPARPRRAKSTKSSPRARARSTRSKGRIGTDVAGPSRRFGRRAAHVSESATAQLLRTIESERKSTSSKPRA